MNIETELNLAVNMFGKIKEDIKTRLRNYLQYPCKDNWEEIYSIILNESWLTVWQAIIAIDPTFPKTGCVTDIQGIIQKDWKRIPTPELLKQALIYATH